MYVNTTIMLSALFALSWFTARTFQYRIFAAPDIGLREIAAGGAALVFCVCLSLAGTRLRSPDEIRSMPINRLMPETARETVLYSITGIAAGIAEEAAYRGVLMHVLWYALGNPWVAVASSAAAFSLGHVLQGWKSMAVIFVLALAMHALVWFTGTLVIAMAVHALYDLLAPTLRRRTLRALPTGPGRSAG